MIISKTALVFITFLIIFSAFVANVTNLISVEIAREPDNQLQKNGHHETRLSGNYTGFTDRMEHLIWFIQISDIHISIFQDKSRITELQEFCDVTISIIKPRVVLASGDLTDAKTKDHIGSRQYEDEWKNYRNVLDKCKIKSKTKWLDIRGNHDNFNVASIDSHENFFQNYSIQGLKHKRSYIHEEIVDDEIYSFLAIDATVDPGPRRPFNFVGILSDEELFKVQKLAHDTRQRGSKYMIWFGHFPTSCILTTNVGGMRQLIGKFDQSLVYVCGHLHQLGGLVKNMYTLQQAGFLELELADWKDNRMYRLLAIDNGFFSFIDARHNEWPQILITNPKHALYTMPNKEPSRLVEESTHIRILAFSVSEIMQVQVRINDEEGWVDCEHVKGPLFVVKWDPKLYKSGIHHIHVNVKDVQGRDKTITQPFALDDTRLNFNILAKIALMTNASTMFQLMYGTLVILCVLPLCILRYVHKLVKEKKMHKPIGFTRCYLKWLRKLWSVVTIDRIFYPLVLYPLYLSIGPWSVGYIIENHFGVIFAWGIFVRNAYLPGSFTYVYGFVQLFMFQVPFTFILANCVDYRINCILDRTKKLKKWYKIILFNVPFFVTMSIQLIFAYFFWLAYGTIAFVLGPLRTWTIIMALVLYWQSIRLPEKCCREAINMLYVKQKRSSTDDDEEIEKVT